MVAPAAEMLFEADDTLLVLGKREDIEKLLGTHVSLKLWVKIREDWRNRNDDLRTLGYE